MTFEEALVELGIDREASPDQVRRAYLKLLKTRKPETDPQGFMRLREAYDLMKEVVAFREMFHHPSEAVRQAKAETALPATELLAPPAAAEPRSRSSTEPAALNDPAPGAPKSAHTENDGNRDAAVEDGNDASATEDEIDRLLAAGKREEAA